MSVEVDGHKYTSKSNNCSSKHKRPTKHLKRKTNVIQVWLMIIENNSRHYCNQMFQLQPVLLKFVLSLNTTPAIQFPLMSRNARSKLQVKFW